MCIQCGYGYSTTLQKAQCTIHFTSHMRAKQGVIYVNLVKYEHSVMVDVVLELETGREPCVLETTHTSVFIGT